MPRRKLTDSQPAAANQKLTKQLAQAIQNNAESGQPLIYERELGSARLRVMVIWDAWAGTALDERTAVILAAYDSVDKDTRKRIALASGLTVPEATAAGVLPYQVGTALRRNDPVTWEQCRDAMVAEGASTLFEPSTVQLRFATEQEAEACRKRLIQRLPASQNVWLVSREILVQDFITLQDGGA